MGLIALVTVGVVMIGFPYLTFLPTLADDRFDVGAVGYGVMSGVAGLGAVVAGLINAARSSGLRPWATIAWSGAAFGVALIALGVANSYPLALVALAFIGASGLMFQTSTQALLLRISALEYHGRLQSMVILGFSGFGLMALPLGLLADAVTLRVTLAGDGCGRVGDHGAVLRRPVPPPWSRRCDRDRLTASRRDSHRPVDAAHREHPVLGDAAVGDPLHQHPRDDGVLAGLPVQTIAGRTCPHPVAGDHSIVDGRLGPAQRPLESRRASSCTRDAATPTSRDSSAARTDRSSTSSTASRLPSRQISSHQRSEIAHNAASSTPPR